MDLLDKIYIAVDNHDFHQDYRMPRKGVMPVSDYFMYCEHYPYMNNKETDALVLYIMKGLYILPMIGDKSDGGFVFKYYWDIHRDKVLENRFGYITFKGGSITAYKDVVEVLLLYRTQYKGEVDTSNPKYYVDWCFKFYVDKKTNTIVVMEDKKTNKKDWTPECILSLDLLPRNYGYETLFKFNKEGVIVEYDPKLLKLKYK